MNQDRRIVFCYQCGKRTGVPRCGDTLEVTCPNCGAVWTLEPESATHTPEELSDWIEERNQAVREWSRQLQVMFFLMALFSALEIGKRFVMFHFRIEYPEALPWSISRTLVFVYCLLGVRRLKRIGWWVALVTIILLPTSFWFREFNSWDDYVMRPLLTGVFLWIGWILLRTREFFDGRGL